VAVVIRELTGCEGFRVEAPQGLIGWVEEPWLGADGEPAALAVRMIDGRDGLLLREDVESVVPEHELVVMRGDGRLLELEAPRLEAPSQNGLSASWRTTGEILEPPDPPGALDRALLTIRPWRLAPPPSADTERPLWQQLTVLYTVLTLVVGLITAFAFLAAHLAA
jgi:hypothetical protein